MYLSGSQESFNIIQPLPRFYTIRFGRRNDSDDNEKARESKINETNQPSPIPSNEENSSPIMITGIRNRDWHFLDDPREITEQDLPRFNYQLIPSLNNTIKNRLANLIIEHNGNPYEDYDLDEQDFQWLTAYNQFRIEKHLPEVDENVFEYIIQLLEHQCLVTIRQKNYEDTIQCDACHRIDDVDNLIQCIKCQIIVHKKCYGIDENVNPWLCLSCEYNHEPHRCWICDKNEGAMKIFKLVSDEQEISKWVHLACAFWSPKFEFDDKMTPILKEPLQYDGRCSICGKTTGVKLNCCGKNCQERFHALCAIENGHDMLLAKNDDQHSIHLLALCDRHTEKIDLAEKRLQLNKSLETKHKRFEQFPTYIDLDKIQNETQILPDVLEAIHTYWILKRKANNCQPLIDLPDDIFYHNYNKTINLTEFARQYHQNQPEDLLETQTNVLPILETNMLKSPLLSENCFVKYAQRNRSYFIDYERNRFCLIDVERKKR